MPGLAAGVGTHHRITELFRIIPSFPFPHCETIHVSRNTCPSLPSHFTLGPVTSIVLTVFISSSSSFSFFFFMFGICFLSFFLQKSSHTYTDFGCVHTYTRCTLYRFIPQWEERRKANSTMLIGRMPTETRALHIDHHAQPRRPLPLLRLRLHPVMMMTSAIKRTIRTGFQKCCCCAIVWGTAPCVCHATS